MQSELALNILVMRPKDLYDQSYLGRLQLQPHLLTTFLEEGREHSLLAISNS